MSALRNFSRGLGGRRLWLVGATLVAAASFGVMFVAASGAAPSPCPIPGNFEIDGDMTQHTCDPPADDWNTPNIGVQSTTQGGTYSTSGKDGGDPSTWTSSGSTPDKTDFAQAYATSRVVNGHFFVFVAWERTNTTGTQGYAIEITNSGSNVGADGTPQPNRGSGGTVFYISSQGSAAPAFNSACSYTSQSDYGTTCTNSSASVTAAINTASMNDPLNNTTQPAGGFFETALDVTALTGIAPSCPGPSAASVYLRSITGQTKNGNLKGYMAPLNVAPDSTCVPPPITTTANPGGSTAAIGSSQHDDVTVSDGTNVGVGTVKFFLCSPAVVTANGGDCSANGTQVGSTATLDVNGQASSSTVNGSTTPNDLTPGKYCWRAEFTPGANDHHFLAGSHTNSTTECFTVVKNTTLIGTAASSQTVGAAIHDVATLSGATANAGGTITFNLYGPSDTPDCSGSAVFTSTVSVSGNGNYNSGDFTPSTAGKYYWIASYSGDANNFASTGTCGDQGETSTIGKKTTSISTAATSGTLGDAVHDVATLSGATATAGGTITFNLYGPSASPDCSGNPVYTNTVNVSGPGNYNSGNFTPSAAGSYYWIASYSGDVNNLPSTGSCGDQGETSTLDKRPTAIVTAATSATIGDAVHDVATLSGASANAGGTITFNLYGPSDTPDCGGAPVFSATVNVSGNGNYNSGNFTPTTAGKYYWIASYSGDANNLPSTGTCGDEGETSTIGKKPTSIVTAATSGTLGDAVHDIATLSGATANAGGTITFNLYGPSASPDCSGTAVYTNTVNVSGPGNYNSGNFTPTAAGKYYWIASYSGDVNNQPSSGSCGDSGETSTLDKRPTSIVTAATSATIGDAVHDIATLSGASAGAGGTITFSLYGPSDNPDCSGNPVFTNTVNVSGNGNYNSGNFTPSTAGKYYWIASYSGDANNLPSTGSCGDQGETSTIGKKTTSISTAATSATIGDAVHDIATLSGATANAGGTITFHLYGPSDTPDCSGNPVYSNTVNVSGPGNYNSGNFTPTAAGKYYWIASYSGDVNNLPSSGSCGDEGETSTISKASPAISTTQSETAGSVNDVLNDTAHLSGGIGFDGSGTITFNLYAPNDPNCDGTPAYTETVTADHNGDYTTSNASVLADSAGIWNWTATFSGDGNNEQAVSGCGAEPVAIGAPLIHIHKTADATQVNAGDDIGFTLTVWNSGSGDAKGVVLTDTLPTNPGLSWSVDAAGAGFGSGADCSISLGVLTCGPETVPAGTDEQSSTFWVHLTSHTDKTTGGACNETGGLVHNTGHVATTNDGMDDSSAEICVAAPAIHIVKTADAAQVNAGDPIGFTLTVSNSGNGDAYDTTLTDTLPTNPGLNWVVAGTGAGWSAPCSITSGVLTCGPDTVPAGTTQGNSTFTVHITSTTDKTTGGDCQETSGVVDNTGHVSTSNDGSDSSEASVCVAAPAIHIVKTADAAQVNVGEDIGFTLTVWNDGNGAAKDVVLNDVLPTNPGLSWSIDGTGAGFGSTCSIAAGVLHCGPVTVPAGTTKAASTFTVHVTSGTTGATGGDCPKTGVVDNTASVTTSNDGSDESSASTCVKALVDLSITKSGSPASQVLGDGNITWTMVVTNNGPSADTGVKITDPMPTGNTFVSATTTKGTCSGGAVLTCDIGPMAAGESVTITLITTPTVEGTQTNTVAVSGDRAETNTANNQATATVEVGPFTPPAPCIAVSKVTPKQLFVGRKTTLKIHVTQGGKAVKGIHVRIKGAKVNIRTKASNSKGLIKRTIKMRKAGVLVFTPIASKRCNTKRVGVTNVFTPPVTG